MTQTPVYGTRGGIVPTGAGAASGNPFLVGGSDTATPFSGTRLLDDGVQLSTAIANGDWLGGSLAGASTVMDAVSFAVNPLGGLVAMGVGWVLDHIEPLKSWLNDLTGDAGAVHGGAETWRRIASGLARAGADLTRSLDSALGEAKSLAVDAYRRLASDIAAHVDLGGQLAGAIGTGLQLAASIVQVVHDLVRDAISDVVGSAVSCLIPLPTTIADLIAKVAKWVTRLSTKLKELVKSFLHLDELFTKARGVMDDVAAAFRRIRSGAAHHADDLPARAPSGHAPGSGADVPGGHTPAAEAAAHPSAAAQASKDCTNGLDPVDLAKGVVFIEKVDVELPGAFPLVLRRRYVSGFRFGRSFGTRWASTLDEHVDTADDRLVLVRWDGSLLLFGEPDGDGVAVPVAGVDRWQLRREGVPSTGSGTVSGSGIDSAEDPSTGSGIVLAEDPSTGSGIVSFTVTDPVEGVRYLFAGAGRRKWLVEQSDRAGRWVRFDRDDVGRVVRVRHHGGYEVLVTTDDARVTGIDLVAPERPAADPSATLRLATFDYRAGSLVAETHGTDGTLHYEVDEVGRVTAWTDSNHVRYGYRYDDQDRCTHQGTTNPGQLEVMRFAIAYPEGPEPGGHTTVVTNPDGGTDRYLVDDRGLVTARIDPTGATTRYEYDPWCRRVAATDALGHTTRYAFDADSRLLAVTDGTGATTRVDYGPRGLPVRVVDPAGAVSEYAWDERGRLLASRDAAGAVTRWQRDPSNDVVVVTDPTGRWTRIDHNPAGLPLRVSDAAGATLLERDVCGRVSAHTDALGATTRQEWSPTGRLLARTDAAGGRERWRYDGEGNLVEAVDAAGRVTRYRYGPFDVLVGLQQPDGSTLAFDYDAERRLVAVTNATGATWRYERDLAGRVVAETDYDGRRTTFALDAAGRVVATTNPAGQTVGLALDAAGRVLAREADGVRTEFRYDPAGRLLEAAGGDTALARRYDTVGRLVAETVGSGTVAWELDAAGRVLARTTPSGAVSRWELDAAGRRAGLDLAGHRVQQTLDPLGRSVATDFAGGRVTAAFDVLGRLSHQTAVAVVGGSAAWEAGYRYAPTGELLATTDSPRGTRGYQLDGVGRVTAVTGAGTETYSYDPAGNLTTATWQTPAADRAGDSEVAGAAAARGERVHRGTLLVRAGRDHYDHDAAGRVVRRRRALPSGGALQWHFAWDSLDRLTAVTTPDGHTWWYRYDPLGRRTGKDHHDPAGALVETWRFAWDGPVLVEQTHATPASVATTTWEHDGFVPIAQHRTRAARPAGAESFTPAQTDAEFAAIVTDLVGTPTRLLDTAGRTTWTDQQTLWGATVAAPGGADQAMPLRFPGQYHDAETGWNYNLHRYYDPTTGRYATPDPLGLAPSPNPWTYPANPTTHTDPLGLQSCTDATKTADNFLPGLPRTAPKPLGLGSTGRVEPANLTEQLAMTTVRSDPAGVVLRRVPMTDARWPASDGWVKMQQIERGVNIHYVRNTLTGAVDDFKFK
jgi:RHS repeat-associated protein